MGHENSFSMDLCRSVAFTVNIVLTLEARFKILKGTLQFAMYLYNWKGIDKGYAARAYITIVTCS